MEKIRGLGNITDAEKALIAAAIPELAGNIQKVSCMVLFLISCSTRVREFRSLRLLSFRGISSFCAVFITAGGCTCVYSNEVVEILDIHCT